MDQEIGFSFKLGEGSKFYLRIKCKTKPQEIFLKYNSKTNVDKIISDLGLTPKVNIHDFWKEE